MRQNLSTASICFALLILIGPGVAAQEGFSSERAQEAVTVFKAERLKLQEGISDARAEWGDSMAVARKDAIDDSDNREANTIQGVIDAVEDGWPPFDSEEHEALVAGWGFRSAPASRAKGIYRKKVRIAVGKANKAREGLNKELGRALKKALSKGGEEDLMEANRIQAWLDGGGPPGEDATPVYSPWPYSVQAVTEVMEELNAACERAKRDLVECLDDARRAARKSGDEGGREESVRIQELIDKLQEKDGLDPADLEQSGFESDEAKECLGGFLPGGDMSAGISTKTRLNLVKKLEKARRDAMREGGPNVLLTANRIQETIREVLSREAFCRAEERDTTISLKILKEHHDRGRALKGRKPILEALDWLVGHQDPDGKWDSDEFMKHDPKSDKCDGPGAKQHDVGVTGLALLAFLECGTDEHSTLGEAMIKGGLWLTSQQGKEGLIGKKLGHTYLYSHAIATVALCDLYAITGNSVFGESAQRAVKYVCLSRNHDRAWRYESPPNRDNDTSVTAWMVTAIHSARRVGLEVDGAAFEGARRWIEYATESATGRIGYDDKGTASARVPGVNVSYPTDRTETMTAAGLHCRFLLGQVPSKDPIMVKHADLLMKSLPEWDPDGLSNDMYYWRWGSAAMSLMGGKKHWPSWQEAMKTAALESQRTEGPAGGSWDPIGPWGFAGGRVYATAMMVSALVEVLQ